MVEFDWGRAFKGMIDEAEKIAIDKELPPSQGDESADVPLNFGSQLEEADQKQCNECRPNFELERVGRSTDKSFDPEILFDAFEKEFQFPASLINGGDGFGTQVQMVASVNELALALVIPPDHAAKEALVVFCGVLVHNNGFVLSNLAPGSMGPGIHHNPGCIVF